MSGKNLHINLLFDYYGEMLTDKQKEVMDLYYNEDMSLFEISEHVRVTRQGVHDLIKRSEAILLEMDEKLGFVEKLTKVNKEIEKIEKTLSAASNLNMKRLFSKELGEMIDYMKQSVESIKNDEEVTQ